MVSKLLPYDQWPDDPFQRMYQAEAALGQALVVSLKGQRQFIRMKFAALAPTLTEAELEALVTEAAFSGIYALLMVLDGVAGTGIDAEHGIEWALQARILKYGAHSDPVEVAMESGDSVTLSSFRPAGTERTNTVEVVPNGDGLCYAFHEWKEANDDNN